MKNFKPKRRKRLSIFRKLLNRKKQERKQKTAYTPYKASRRLARRLARAKMEREGMQRINRRIKGGDSLFAREWRHYVGYR